MSRPIASFVIPAYNAGQTIEETISSLDHCGCDDFEVIIVDDGSKDDTYDVADRNLKRKGKIIRTSVNYGCSTAMNIGINEARGRYIARLDADDICAVNRLRMQLTRLESDPSLSFCGGAVQEFGIRNDVRNLPLTVDRCNAQLPIYCCFSASTATYDRERIGSALYHDPCFGVCEDYDLWARLVMSGAYGLNLEEICVHWRQHTTQQTRAKESLFLSGDLQIKQKLISHILIRDSQFASFILALYTTRPFLNTRPDFAEPFLDLLNNTRAIGEFSTPWARTKELLVGHVASLKLGRVDQADMSELIRFSLKAFSKGTAVNTRRV